MFMGCLLSVLFTSVYWIKDFVLKYHETLKHFFVCVCVCVRARVRMCVWC